MKIYIVDISAHEDVEILGVFSSYEKAHGYLMKTWVPPYGVEADGQWSFYAKSKPGPEYPPDVGTIWQWADITEYEVDEERDIVFLNNRSSEEPMHD